MVTVLPILAVVTQLRQHEEQFLEMHKQLEHEFVFSERKFSAHIPFQMLSAKGIKYFSQFMEQYVRREENDESITGYRHARATLLVALRNSGQRHAAQELFKRWNFIESRLKLLDKAITSVNSTTDVVAWKRGANQTAQAIYQGSSRGLLTTSKGLNAL